MNKFYLQKDVLSLSQRLPKFRWCGGKMRFIDKSLQILLSTGWVPGLLVSIIFFLLSPFTTAHSPWRVRQQPKTSRETPVKHPWTTREPPVNHPWITREPSVIHPWTIHETSVLETQKTGLETWKTYFVPWATRETPVKQPWSIREAPVNDPGTLSEHALTGKLLPSLQVPNIKYSLP